MTKTIPRRVWALLLVGILPACSAEAPAPDAPLTLVEGTRLGHPDSVLFWNPDQQLAGFPNYDRIFPTRRLPAGTDPLPLPAAPRDLGDLRYQVEGEEFGVDDFMEVNQQTGLIVVRDGRVLLERYTLGHTRDTRWVSYSVAKSVVSLLIGAAIQDGYILGVDDPVTRYLPLLEGSGYDGATVRDVLHMASGVEWNEDYTDPQADVSREIGLPNLDRLRFYAEKPRVAEPGTRFNYSTGETHLVGALLRSAVGNNLTEYLHQKIWEPFGMESEANWRLVEPSGPEHGGCCISATLRDYARLGLFALADGTLADGTRVVPEGWMAESLAPSPGYPGYGYLWWLGEDGSYSARGIFGQLIFVDPSMELVVATHGVWEAPVGRRFSAHRDAFLDALRESLEG